jgi:hypothetical protein
MNFNEEVRVVLEGGISNRYSLTTLWEGTLPWIPSQSLAKSLFEHKVHISDRGQGECDTQRPYRLESCFGSS